jgi:phage terminase small subunit
MAKLTAKQQAFVSNKAAGVTNRDAAIAAGYAVAGAEVAAGKLMRNPAIRKAIKAATKDAHPTDTKSNAPVMPRAKYTDAMTFLKDVMNHAGLPIAMRADAAKQLLPYMHARLGEVGKKEKAKDRARVLSGQRFRPNAPPTLHAIDGGKAGKD